MANVYTRTGDKGETGLVGGSRVSKSSPRVDCYGTIDEANSMLGLARAQTDVPYICENVEYIQKRLFSLAAEIASDEQGVETLKEKIQEEDVTYLEGIVDTCAETTGLFKGFVVPGVDAASSALHVARTIVRRCERAAVSMVKTESVREVLMRYINRLSDAIYAMARLQEVTTQQKTLKDQVTSLVREKLEEAGVTAAPFDLDNIRRMADRAKEKSKELGVPIVFAAVDEGGNLLYLERMEGALIASVDIARAKAYTASTLKMSTQDLGQAAGPDGPLYGIETAVPGKIVLFGGGFPYRIGDKVVGGIGVSGGTVEEDMEIARWAMTL